MILVHFDDLTSRDSSMILFSEKLGKFAWKVVNRYKIISQWVLTPHINTLLSVGYRYYMIL